MPIPSRGTKMDDNNSTHLKLMIASTAVIIALLLTLILLLLTQLYCSLFLRHRRRHHTTAAAATQQPPHPSDLCTFYAHGVLRAPRSFLFPDPHLQFHNYNSNYSNSDDLENSPNSSATTADEQVMAMYSIINPIYDEDGGVTRKAEDAAAVDGGTPPLTPMKKLPSECPSVSVTHTDSINAAISSSSSSPSSFTSPSW